MKVLLQTNEFPLIASPKLTKELGASAAIFFQKLHYLLLEADKKKYKKPKFFKVINNRKWYYHSFEKWQTTLGMFSLSTIKRAVVKLRALGLIEVQKLDPEKQVNYYTINYKKLKELFGISVERKATPPTPPVPEKSQNIVGTDSPTQPEASLEGLAVLQSQHRELYRKLRGLKVDISHEDPLIFHYANTPREILAYAASASNRLDINRWQWYVPEQILPQHFFLYQE